MRVVPKNTCVYEISGPLFFGAADKILKISLDENIHSMVLRMRSVGSIDATAMNRLEVLYKECVKLNINLIFSH